ncbi:MAG TPA: hypothetical protein VNE39_24435 [Planctomycetota bacterium]|nr:hypothetical protein [Planctomycetota bacterium]
MTATRLDLMLVLLILGAAAVQAAEPLAIGSRLELLMDDYLIERMGGAAQLRMHRPIPREICLVLDAPWEGNGCGYVTVLQDGDTYRMYYRGHTMKVEGGKVTQPNPMVTCMAESKDGIRWAKPELGLFEFAGSKRNNIVRVGDLCHDFSPFVDANPACPPEARYKGVGALGMRKGLLAYQSPDGVRWSPMNDGKPVITQGAFDTQNLAFWDAGRGEYRAYVRDFRDGVRDIRTATSKDFIHWTEPAWLVYPGAAKEHLYTNQIKPYYRAPHLFIGFPTRYIDRGWSPAMKALSELEHRELRAKANRRYGTALTEGLLMTSRDGLTFHRWPEAFLRPGLRLKGNWKYGDNYIAWHVVETASHLPNSPNELSLYATEGYWTGTSVHVRRYTLRMDGFVSASAPMSGGEFVTRPFTFEGKQLVLNMSTSAAGSIRVEVQDAGGKPVQDRSLADCPDIFGDTLEHVVAWSNGSDVAALAGKPIRLRITLRDADLFALRFR